jgi:Sigma-70, region 4/HicB family
VEAEESTSPTWSEDRLLLAGGVRVLDERERRIVLLRFHRDLTEQQIADELGISQAHVSRLLSRALAKLREALSEDGPRVVAATSTADASPVHREPEERTRSHQDRPSRKPASGSSGRFLVRMPGALHEQLTEAAEREHVSLNRFITERLTESLSRTEGAPTPAPAPESPVAPGPESAVAKPEERRRLRMLVAANLVIIILALAVAITLLVLALERGL